MSTPMLHDVLLIVWAMEFINLFLSNWIKRKLLHDVNGKKMIVNNGQGRIKAVLVRFYPKNESSRPGLAHY